MSNQILLNILSHINSYTETARLLEESGEDTSAINNAIQNAMYSIEQLLNAETKEALLLIQQTVNEIKAGIFDGTTNRIDALPDKIKDIISQILNLPSNMTLDSYLSQRFSEVKSDISQLENNMKTHVTTEISSITTLINNLHLDQLEQRLSQLDSITNNINNIDSQITAITNTLTQLPSTINQQIEQLINESITGRLDQIISKQDTNSMSIKNKLNYLKKQIKSSNITTKNIMNTTRDELQSYIEQKIKSVGLDTNMINHISTQVAESVNPAITNLQEVVTQQIGAIAQSIETDATKVTDRFVELQQRLEHASGEQQEQNTEIFQQLTQIAQGINNSAQALEQLDGLSSGVLNTIQRLESIQTYTQQLLSSNQGINESIQNILQDLSSIQQQQQTVDQRLNTLTSIETAVTSLITSNSTNDERIELILKRIENIPNIDLNPILKAIKNKRFNSPTLTTRINQLSHQLSEHTTQINTKFDKLVQLIDSPNGDSNALIERIDQLSLAISQVASKHDLEQLEKKLDESINNIKPNKENAGIILRKVEVLQRTCSTVLGRTTATSKKINTVNKNIRELKAKELRDFRKLMATMDSLDDILSERVIVHMSELLNTWSPDAEAIVSAFLLKYVQVRKRRSTSEQKKASEKKIKKLIKVILDASSNLSTEATRSIIQWGNIILGDVKIIVK